VPRIEVEYSAGAPVPQGDPQSTKPQSARANPRARAASCTAIRAETQFFATFVNRGHGYPSKVTSPASTADSRARPPHRQLRARSIQGQRRKTDRGAKGNAQFRTRVRARARAHAIFRHNRHMARSIRALWTQGHALITTHC